MIENIKEFFSKSENIIGIGIILGVLILVLLVNLILKNIGKKTKKLVFKFARTRIINSIVSIIIIIIAIAYILKKNNVDITGYIAGLGIATVVVAFAIQDFLKDTISGLCILLENYFKIGDVIIYDNEYYEVIDLSLKVTKIKKVDNGDIYTISNHLIEEARVCSGEYLLVVPGAYEYEATTMREICEEIASLAKKDNIIKDCKFIGTNYFQSSQIDYTLRVKVDPINIGVSRRLLNGLIQDVFKTHNIEIPFNQLDVHIKEK